MATTLNFDKFLPEGEHLFPFQQVGVAYALHQTREGKGCFVGDEQGLGKTAQAITIAKVHAALDGNLSPKVLVVVKASLRGNWESELLRFAPEWTTQVLAGSVPYEVTDNVAVIGYNLLRTWADALVEENFNIVFFDESHFVKDPKTQQSKGAAKVAAQVRGHKGLVLLLTGTPLLNRPVELVNQLAIMGRLHDIAPQPRKTNPTDRDWEFAFKNHYCYGGNNGYGTVYNGARHLDLLNQKLRGNCLVRRQRDEVLDLEETHRIRIPLSLNGGLDNYWKVERTFQPKHPNSAAIELLTALRQAAGLAKIPAAVEWVQDFVEENPGKKLVVWADHIPVQQGVAAALNKAGIEAIYWAGEKDVEEAKKEFNEGDAIVIVASLKAHGFGHTLVGDGNNVTDSLFIEQPWHPGAVMQAEDRINRIGQKAAAVFAHRLVVPGTVDEWLDDLIAEKWEIVKAAIEGRITATVEDIDIQKLMLERLKKHYADKYGKPIAGGEDLRPGDVE